MVGFKEHVFYLALRRSITVLLLACASAFAISSSAIADAFGPGSGWYIEGRIGGPLNKDADSTIVSPNVPANNGPLETESHDGYGFAVAVGKFLNDRTRVEVEYSRTRAEDLTIDYTRFAPANVFFGRILDANGNVSLDMFLGNLLFTVAELNVLGHRVRPFVGAGAGLVHIKVNDVAPPLSRFAADDEDTVFAGALHVGVDVPVAQNIDFTLRYSPTYIADSSFAQRDTLALGGIATTEVDSRVGHYVGFGLRYRP